MTEDKRQATNLRKYPAWTATACFILGSVGLVAWLIPAVGLPVTVAGLILGKIGLESAQVERARKGMKLAAIGLMLTIVNGLLGILLGILR
jgi:uncharacterized membrane protein YecN with MAPEG domain